MQQSAFKAYDIRGIVGQDICVEQVSQFTHAFIAYVAQYQEVATLVIGQDRRSSSSLLYASVVQAALEAGLIVYDVGIAATPYVQYVQYEKQADIAMMITASHNPDHYNGFKLFDTKGSIAQDRLQEVYQCVVQGKKIKSLHRGLVQKVDDMQTYIQSLYDIHNPFRCIIDVGTGVMKDIMHYIVDTYNWDCVVLADATSGMQTNDPTQQKNIQKVIDMVVAGSYDFGVAFDGDGDRLVFVDGTGRVYRGDELFALFILYSMQSGQICVADSKSSLLVEQIAKQKQGTCIRSATGCVNIKTKMKEYNAAFGGEVSGHYFFSDDLDQPVYDDALKALSLLLSIFKLYGGPQKVCAAIPRLYASSEIRMPMLHVEKCLQRIQKWAEGQQCIINQVDGIRISTESYWLLFRASQTEPVISIRYEGVTKQDAHTAHTLVHQLLQPHVASDVLRHYVGETYEQKE